MDFTGILTGLFTFLIIGMFHPAVIKAEYYLGQKSRWIFLVAGMIAAAFSLFADNVFVSVLSGVFSFSSFWSILEVRAQERRVLKGWFPMNPKRAAYYESKRMEENPS